LASQPLGALGSKFRHKLGACVCLEPLWWLEQISLLAATAAATHVAGPGGLCTDDLAAEAAMATLAAECSDAWPYKWLLPLLREVRVVELVGAGLRVTPHLKEASSIGGFNVFVSFIARSCCYVASAFPEEVRKAAGGVEGSSRGSAGASTRLSSQGGAHGGSSAASSHADKSAAAAAAAAASSHLPGWHPQYLRALLPELRRIGHMDDVSKVEALLAKLEVCGATDSGCDAGRDSGSGGGGDVGMPGGAEPFRPPPAAARLLLPVCSNPCCVNLAGDSEADLRLQPCGRCGAVSYCG
ncbi:hypothetical protein Agub_g12456, partial [Astrephomene gubernaculifera]